MKYRIYIDFEAFNFLGVRNAQPFAFSIAAIDDKTKKIKTKTFINDFDKKWSVEFMKARLVISVKKILGHTKVNILEEVEFVAFGAELEASILRAWFGHNVKITDLGRSLHGSLSALTANYGETKSYFTEHYNKFLDNLPITKIKRLNLMGDGAFVGMFGSYMLQDPRYKAKFKGIEFTELEKAKIIEIMKTYSVDDVLRLIYLEENFDAIKIISDNHKRINREIQTLNNKKRMYATTVKCLTDNPNMTVAKLKKEIEQIETQVIDLKDQK